MMREMIEATRLSVFVPFVLFLPLIAPFVLFAHLPLKIADFENHCLKGTICPNGQVFATP